MRHKPSRVANPGDVISTADLRALLVLDLVDHFGGSASAWIEAIGPVTVYEAGPHDDTNWLLLPFGSPHEREAILEAEVMVRRYHPFIKA